MRSGEPHCHASADQGGGRWDNVARRRLEVSDLNLGVVLQRNPSVQDRYYSQIKWRTFWVALPAKNLLRRRDSEVDAAVVATSRREELEFFCLRSFPEDECAGD